VDQEEQTGRPDQELILDPVGRSAIHGARLTMQPSLRAVWDTAPPFLIAEIAAGEKVYPFRLP
jgi:hypothetical protein